MNNTINGIIIIHHAHVLHFYAKDIGLSSAIIKSLHKDGYIKPTGNTRKEIISIHNGQDTMEVIAKEWVVTLQYIQLVG